MFAMNIPNTTDFSSRYMKAVISTIDWMGFIPVLTVNTAAFHIKVSCQAAVVEHNIRYGCSIHKLASFLSY
jgi:hypothetical protein